MSKNQLQTIEKESSQLVSDAKKFEVTSQINYDEAAGFVVGCKALKKRIEIFFKPTIEKFKETKKVADEGRKAEVERMDKYLSPVLDAISLVQNRCKKFEDDQEKIRIEKQKKLDKEAEEKAAEEKKVLEDQAEVDKAWGDNEAAEEKKEEAAEIEVEKVKAKPTMAKQTGLGIRRTWQWRITDPNKIPRGFLTIDEVLINREVNKKKEDTNIPGIEVFYN